MVDIVDMEVRIMTICGKCGGSGYVYMTRGKENGTVYRRRKCKRCGNKWTTVELDVAYMKGVISGMTEILNGLRKR